MSVVEMLERLKEGISRSASVSGIADRSDMTAWVEDLSRALDALRGPEPDWSSFGSSARWYAVDADGSAFTFEDKPSPEFEAWVSEREERQRRIGRVSLPLGVDWRLTLRERPDGV